MDELNNHKTRRQRRYEKRSAERLRKKEQKQLGHSFCQMYDIDNWVVALKQSRKGTSWKSSVQYYSYNPIISTVSSIDKLDNGEFPFRINTERVVIYERGKKRKIEPIKIPKRHCEHVFCDEIYAPLLFPTLIYDNGASQKCKGVNFTRTRFEKHLKEMVDMYGNDFYVFKFDFKSFFDSINYNVCRKLFTELFGDERSVNFAMDSLTEYSKGNIILEQNELKKKEMEDKFNSENACGVCLGSQVSQITALMIPNKLDHYIKDKMRAKRYDRFMDDGIVLAKTKEELEEIYDGCKRLADDLKLTFNVRKTHITRASEGITFLKIKYNIVDGKNGTYHILKRPSRATVVRMRRKLKKFKKLVDKGEMRMQDVLTSFMSWYGNMRKVARTYKSRKEMVKLYISLFGYHGLSRINKRYSKYDPIYKIS